MNANIYEMREIKHCYGDLVALGIEGISISSGTITGLVGPNGSGKSTLLRLLSFLEKPSQGEIFFKGNRIESSTRSARLQVTLLNQEPYLLKRSVMENIAYGLKVRGKNQGYEGRVQEALSWVGLAPREFARRQWYELSGGEAQRVALASRLVLGPQVLLLDEPTSSVDATSATLIKEASLRAREQWGTTLLIASHDWSWLNEVCDEVLHLFRGNIIGSGMGNVIFGPWSSRSDGFSERRLSSGKAIVVTAAPNEESVAVINPGSVSIHTDTSTEEVQKNALPGTISALALQKRSGKVLVTAAVDSIYFHAELSDNEVRDRMLFPGRQAW
ncbi:MAG: ATP-binding cassette domain-containing protein, partial [Geobacteraceae bacterium]